MLSRQKKIAIVKEISFTIAASINSLNKISSYTEDLLEFEELDDAIYSIDEIHTSLSELKDNLSTIEEDLSLDGDSTDEDDEGDT